MKRLFPPLVLGVFLIFLFCLEAKTNPKKTSELFVQLSKQLIPSVVNIYTTQKVIDRDMRLDIMEHFFGIPQPYSTTPRLRNSLGSGFIIDEKKGLIITNHHVVANADSIEIVLFGEDKERDSIKAKLIASDPESDLAILKINTKKKLKAAKLGSSQVLKVGEIVLAIGNPFGLGSTVTQGIVSAKGRVFPMSRFANYVQTDAPINPGNSGGPLINLDGEVVGMNTFINAAAQGIGFAIQIDYVKKVLPDLLKEGKVTRGFIGVQIAELTPNFAESLKLDSKIRGVIVVNIYRGRSAEKAGLQPYDIILEVDNKKVQTSHELVRTITAKRPGQVVKMLILRNGKKTYIQIPIEKRAKPKLAHSPQKGNRRNNIGLVLEKLSPKEALERRLPVHTQGLVVRNVRTGSPADKAGINPGQIILEVNKQALANVSSFYRMLRVPRKYILKIHTGTQYILRTLDLTKP